MKYGAELYCGDWIDKCGGLNEMSPIGSCILNTWSPADGILGSLRGGALLEEICH